MGCGDGVAGAAVLERRWDASGLSKPEECDAVDGGEGGAASTLSASTSAAESSSLLSSRGGSRWPRGAGETRAAPRTARETLIARSPIGIVSIARTVSAHASSANVHEPDPLCAPPSFVLWWRTSRARVTSPNRANSVVSSGSMTSYGTPPTKTMQSTASASAAGSSGAGSTGAAPGASEAIQRSRVNRRCSSAESALFAPPSAPAAASPTLKTSFERDGAIATLVAAIVSAWDDAAPSPPARFVETGGSKRVARQCATPRGKTLFVLTRQIDYSSRGGRRRT